MKPEVLSAEKKRRGCTLIVDYEGKRSRIESASLVSGHIGHCIGVFIPEFKFVPGQRIRDGKRDLTVLKVYRGTLAGGAHKHKMLTYQCNTCGYIKESVREEAVARGIGCPVFSGKVIRKGVNDIPSAGPWMVPYFPGGAAQAERYTPSSGRQLRLFCSYCGKLSNHTIAIATLYRAPSLGCPCGDGISFPEKFLFRFFKPFRPQNIPGRSPQRIMHGAADIVTTECLQKTVRSILSKRTAYSILSTPDMNGCPLPILRR